MFDSIDLLPVHGIRCIVQSGGGARFVCYFRECWGRMPHSAKKTLIDFWKFSRDGLGPLIVLSKEGDSSTELFAHVNRDGTEMTFSGADFAMIPEGVSQCLIAHALALVFRHAIGWKDENVLSPAELADQIAESWGFDMVTCSFFRSLAGTTREGLIAACKQFLNPFGDDPQN